MTAIVLSLVIAGLLYLHERERTAWRLERRELLDRIKPETAPVPDGPPPASVHHIPLDDDEAWAKSHGLEVVA